MFRTSLCVVILTFLTLSTTSLFAETKESSPTYFHSSSGTDLDRLPQGTSRAYRAGMAAASIGKYELAAKNLLLATEETPFFPEAYANASLAYEILGDLPKALELSKKALRQWPTYDEAEFYCGNQSYKLGRWQDALSHYSRLLNRTPNHVRALSNRGATYLRLGKIPEAARDVELALRTDPTYVDAKAHLANIRFEQRRYSEAVDLHKEVLEARKEDLLTRLNLGNAYLESKQFENAKAQYALVQKEAPDRIEAIYGLGMVAYRQKEWDTAKKFFESVLTLDPEHESSLFYLAASLERGQAPDRVNQAIAVLQRLVKKHPSNVEARLNLALLYHAANRTQDAKAEAMEIRKRDKKQYQIYLERRPKSS